MKSKAVSKTIMRIKTSYRLKSPARLRLGVAAAVMTGVIVTGLSAGAQTVSAPDSPTKKSNAWSTQTLTVAPQALNIDVSKLESLGALGTQKSFSSGPDLAGTLSNPGMGTGSPLTLNGLGDSIFELSGNAATPLFDIDTGGQLCLRTTEDCAVEDERLGLGFSRDFSKGGLRGLDLALSPRAGVSFDDKSSSALVGALVKIGDNLQSNPQINPNTWYFFAGADAQAMTYTPGQQNYGVEDSGRFALRDSIIVGDAQAGLAYRLGDADLSLTYLRREARAENYKFEEDAAALSFTWRN